MMVEVGSMWRVDAAFPAISREPEEHREQIESGSLVLVTGEASDTAGPPLIKLSLSNRPYLAYERDLIVAASCVSAH